MASTSQKLEALGFKNLVDFKVQVDETGEHLRWYSQTAQPTQEAIDAVTDEQAIEASKDAKIDRVFQLGKREKVLIKWIAQRTGGGTAAEIRSELKAIWNSLG